MHDLANPKLHSATGWYAPHYSRLWREGSSKVQTQTPITEGYSHGYAISFVPKGKRDMTAVLSDILNQWWPRKAKIKVILNLPPVKQTNPEQPLYILTHSGVPCSRHADSFHARGGRQKQAFPGIQWLGKLSKQVCGVQRKGLIILQSALERTTFPNLISSPITLWDIWPCLRNEAGEQLDTTPCIR